MFHKSKKHKIRYKIPLKGSPNKAKTPHFSIGIGRNCTYPERIPKASRTNSGSITPFTLTHRHIFI